MTPRYSMCTLFPLRFHGFGAMHCENISHEVVFESRLAFCSLRVGMCVKLRFVVGCVSVSGDLCLSCGLSLGVATVSL